MYLKKQEQDEPLGWVVLATVLQLGFITIAGAGRMLFEKLDEQLERDAQRRREGK